MLFHLTPLLLTITFTFVLLLASKAGLMGITATILLLAWFFKYCFVVLDAVVAGAEELPVLSLEMLNPIDEQRPLALALLIAAEALLTLAVARHVGQPAALMCGGLFILLLPASIAVLGMTRNAFRAIWPPALLQIIRGLGAAYAVPVVAMLACAGAVSLLRVAAAPDWLALFCVQMLFLLVAMTIGATLFEHRALLGIETRTRAERMLERETREQAQERHGMLDRAYAKFRVREPEAGWREIESWLALHTPGHGRLSEYRTLLEAASQWDDVRAADRLANDLVSLLLARGATGEALQIVQQRLAGNPQFRLSQRAQAVRLAELAGIAGKRALQQQLAAQTRE
jgi:hypothetical protein